MQEKVKGEGVIFFKKVSLPTKNKGLQGIDVEKNGIFLYRITLALTMGI